MVSSRLRNYLILMRAHQPVGVWLLFWPCAWSILLTCHSIGFSIRACHALLACAVGAFLMRSAGCIANDLADRRLDAHVARTATRPLASGAIRPREAMALAALCTLLSAGLVLPFGWATVRWAIAALPLIVLYPFMKRITWWPQAFLGLTFNWGALLAPSMLGQPVSLAHLALYIGGVFWTLSYDTIYAYQDIEDDAAIGIRSSARALGMQPQRTLALFMATAWGAWTIAFLLTPAHTSLGWIALLAVAAHFSWQWHALDTNNPQLCGSLFKSNTVLGWFLLLTFWPI